MKDQTGNLSAEVLNRIYRKGRKLFPRRSVQYVDHVRGVIEEGLQGPPEANEETRKDTRDGSDENAAP